MLESFDRLFWPSALEIYDAELTIDEDGYAVFRATAETTVDLSLQGQTDFIASTLREELITRGVYPEGGRRLNKDGSGYIARLHNDRRYGREPGLRSRHRSLLLHHGPERRQ